MMPEAMPIPDLAGPRRGTGGTAHADRLQLLQAVGQDITSTLDRECLLERIADATARWIDYDLFALFGWNDEAQRLEALYARRSDGQPTGLDLRASEARGPEARGPENRAPVTDPRWILNLGEGMCGYAADVRRVVRVGNVLTDQRFLDCGDPAVRSAIAIPLVFEGRLLGVLDLESHTPDFFDADDEAWLETLGSSIAVALANAELYERLRADERRLAEDLETAREVQRVLLPRTTPWVPGVQLGVAMSPARELGGDLYDFYRYADGRLAVAIGDVAGKGAGAAMLATLALGLLRGWVSEGSCSPLCSLAYLDDELNTVHLPRRFLAMAYAVVDPRRRVLTLANAGLPYAIVARASGEVEEIELGGLPLGALRVGSETPPRREIEIPLEGDDLVILATDGITESLDSRGRQFGMNGVIETLRDTDLSFGRCVAEALIAAADRHRGAREAADDRTVVTLRLAD